MRFFLPLLFAVPCFGQVANIISADRRVDWTVGTNVGVRGGIPTTRTQSGSTIAAGASAATINTALSSAAAGTYVLLGAGTFTTTETIFVPNNVTLRGSGISTVIVGNFDSTMIAMLGGATVGAAGTISAGYTKGSASITISGGTTPSVGDLIDIFQDDETWVYAPNGGTKHISGIYRVESVAGSVIGIWPALLYGSTGFNPGFAVHNGTTRIGAGVESMRILPSSANTFPIEMAGAYGCWVSNVRIEDISEDGVHMYSCLGCEIAHVDVIGVGASGDGYGIELDKSSNNAAGGNTACAVYNCIFDGLYHGIITTGQQGCVFAYNYSVNEHASTGVVYQTAAINLTHGPEGMMSLTEGNYGNYITTDKIHGGAAYQTLWRNRFHGVDNFYNLGKNAAVFLSEGSYTYNAAGNTFGDPLGESTWPSGTTNFYKYKWTASEFDAASSTNNGGIWMLGYVGSGQALQASVAGTLTFYTNYDYWNQAVQDAGAYTIDNSLAWTSRPSWFGYLAWPAYDPGNPAAYGNAAAAMIPAGYRYINGGDPASGSHNVSAASVTVGTLILSP